MKPKRKTVLSTVAVLLVAVVWMTARGRSRYAMPVYGSKTAEEWFFGSNGHPGLQTTMTDARVAFEAMGTNCAPFLLDKAKTRETTFNRFYCWLHPKLPMLMKARSKPALRATYIQMIAYSHLSPLVMHSDFMADEILESVKMIDDDATRWQAFQSVEVLASRRGGKAYALYFLNDSDCDIQLRSAIILAHIDNKMTNGLPILVKVMMNPNSVSQAISSRFSAGMATSTLQLITRSKQESARQALRMVSPALAEQLEIQQLYSRPNE